MSVGGARGGRVVGGRTRGRGQAGMVTFGGCGKDMRAGNLASHQRGAC